jgi:phospholipid/cholesterol/gamma-HCH transport system ATP-binding protein
VSLATRVSVQSATGVAVEVDDLHKSFGAVPVLTGLSLNFVDGAVTTVLGPSGTGKSVLIKHIVGLLRADRGEVRVFGQNIFSLSGEGLFRMRENFGVLFQDGALFGSMNIYDNVAFPLRQHTRLDEDEIRDIVVQRCQEVGLATALAKMPSEISGGMRKRAGFARALVLNPKIVMFDEPDSGLDPVRTSLLNELILQMHAQHGGTYIIVTHNIETARMVSDYVALMWQGRVVHYSRTDEAFSSEDPFVQQFLHGTAVGPLGMD